MDPERWPEPIRDFVAAIGACGKCGLPREKGVIVTVECTKPAWFGQSIWVIKAGCVKCGHGYRWQITGVEPLPEKVEAIPEPAWYSAL